MKEIISLFIKRKEFFFNLLIQHIEISFISIILAIFIGGIIGIVIAENKKSAKPTLNIINFLYTIPSISMLGFLIPFSGVPLPQKFWFRFPEQPFPLLAVLFPQPFPWFLSGQRLQVQKYGWSYHSDSIDE